MTGAVTARAAMEEALRRRARTDMLSFLRWVWWMPPSTRPLRVGRHTRALCDRLTRAVDDWLEGRSTYLVTNMPFRHGKSDLVSRALPAYFLGRCAAHHPDVIMSGYGTSLVRGFSQKVQSIVSSEAYGRLFPGVRVSPERRAAEDWSVEGSQGVVTAQGLGGAITGRGGNLIVVDDYCKNREEAESATMRDKTWASFSDDLMTRANAPAAIVVVCATRWHEDDVVGRIRRKMAEDPDYPRFEELVFPARKAGEGGWDVLFPELYDAGWYARQRAGLGTYSAAALLDCDPVSDALKVFRREWLCFYDEPPPRGSLNAYMFVDSANSKKANADYTTMLVVGYGADGCYYLLDAVHDRMNLGERTREAFEMHRRWRPLATFWEQVGAMADVAHVQLEQNRLGWHFPIVPLNHRVAKGTRIRALQPLFEAGRVWLPRTLPKRCADGAVRDVVRELVEDEYLAFPGCRHDDIIDPLADVCDAEVAAATSFPAPSDAGGGGEDAGARANVEWRRGR